MSNDWFGIDDTMLETLKCAGNWVQLFICPLFHQWKYNNAGKLITRFVQAMFQAQWTSFRKTFSYCGKQNLLFLAMPVSFSWLVNSESPHGSLVKATNGHLKLQTKLVLKLAESLRVYFMVSKFWPLTWRNFFLLQYLSCNLKAEAHCWSHAP